MGRRKRKKKSQRDVSNITKRSPLLRRLKLTTHPPPVVLPDKRRFTPHVQEPLQIDGRQAQFTVKRPKKTNISNKPYDPTKDRLSFKYPRRVAVCIRRKRRRNVLFAQSKVGKGIKVSKRRRTNEDSKVRC